MHGLSAEVCLPNIGLKVIGGHNSPLHPNLRRSWLFQSVRSHTFGSIFSKRLEPALIFSNVSGISGNRGPKLLCEMSKLNGPDTVELLNISFGISPFI